MRSSNRGKLAIVMCAMLALMAAVRGFPQSPAQPPQDPRSGTGHEPLRVTTRLVQVSVIAQDKNGKPITGLTKDDFTVSDKGKQQTISNFAEQSIDLRASATAVAPANVFTNQLGRNGAQTTVSVILLDFINTRLTNPEYTRQQLVKFLEQMEPEDRVALYSVTTKSIYILHDFTNDTSGIKQMLALLKKESPVRKTSGDPVQLAVPSPDLLALYGQLINPIPGYQSYRTINNVGLTAAALKTIAGRLTKIPGRKNLIWVTGTFPFRISVVDSEMYLGSNPGSHTFNSEIQGAVKALNDANVAIYPIDARGLTYPRLSPNSLDTMQSLAQGTGGLAFYNTNDLGGSIRRAIDDSRVTYTLGYYPAHNDWNGGFREIKVQTTRPGVHLRYRAGYFASPQNQTTTRDKKELLTEALESPIESDDLGLEVQFNTVDSPTPQKLKAEVRISPGQLVFAQNGEHWSDNVEVLWIELDANGRVLGNTSQTVRLNIPRDAVDKILQEGLKFSESIELKSEAVEVRLVLRDTGSGAIGSVNVPLGRLLARDAALPPKK